MSMFKSEFDDFRRYADSFSSDQDTADWGDLPQADSMPIDDLPEWDDVVPDLETDFGDLYRGPFGSTGGDGDAFYYFDAETGSSVML